MLVLIGSHHPNQNKWTFQRSSTAHFVLKLSGLCSSNALLWLYNNWSTSFLLVQRGRKASSPNTLEPRRYMIEPRDMCLHLRALLTGAGTSLSTSGTVSNLMFDVGFVSALLLPFLQYSSCSAFLLPCLTYSLLSAPLPPCSDNPSFSENLSALGKIRLRHLPVGASAKLAAPHGHQYHPETQNQLVVLPNNGKAKNYTWIRKSWWVKISKEFTITKETHQTAISRMKFEQE